ncbi:MAG TPA: magnesium/cobalt transporter CorA [Phycisphaerales bacterium]|nr:magnesium/cobalt transporter CorA [Phycisphaerales bacterium]
MSKASGRRDSRTRRRSPPGADPGALVSEPGAGTPRLHLIAYGPGGAEEQTLRDLGQLDAVMERWPVAWLNIDGVGDAGTVERIGKRFGLHRLALEDVINTDQRSKVEAYAGHLFIVSRMARAPGPDVPCGDTEQLSMFLGPRFVVTFQDKPGDTLEPVRRRIRSDSGRIRHLGTDYLAYSLLDAVIDGYFPLLERAGERLEEVEDEIMTRGDESSARTIHLLKREMIAVRRSIWPLRDALSALLRDPGELIRPETTVYLRDTYDHTVRIIDLVEMYRELGADLMQMYLSQVNNRMNEVIKVLSIIATIFIPLNFIAGLYGMNFDPGASPYNMPELRWRYGYPLSLLAMALVALGMLVYFYRRGWLRPRVRPRPPAPTENSRATAPPRLPRR